MKQLTDFRIHEIKEQIPKSVGLLIRKVRKSKKYSQSELAEAVGKDRQYLYKIEKGLVTPNIATIVIIAEALEVPVSSFFNVDFKQID